MARKPLNRERIEDAALRLVGREGLDGFSMRKLGRMLGVEAMSLYHHFPSQAHLLDALVDRLIASLPHPEDLPGSVEERLEMVMRAYRALAQRHPRFFPYLVQHRFNSAPTLRFLEGMVGLFLEAGHPMEVAVPMFRVGGYFLAGCALEENVEVHSAAQPVSLEEQRERFPRVYAAAPYFAGHRDEAFELGVRLLVSNLRGDFAGSSGKTGRGTRRSSGPSPAPPAPSRRRSSRRGGRN
ncbi:MAG: TetR/AcrR family transcriptional regulator [Myxococcales bacterium]